jgi:cobalt-zinc-cadmium efflux system protein
VESAFLHVVGDAVSSVGVIIAALVIGATGWQWVDPLVSVLIGIMIMLSSWRVLKSSLHILVEGVPEGMSIQEVARVLTDTPGVGEVHDLHVWSVCSGHIALSAHVTLASGRADSGLVMMEMKRRLHDQFDIEHTTIQIEAAEAREDHLIQVD